MYGKYILSAFMFDFGIFFFEINIVCVYNLSFSAFRAQAIKKNPTPLIIGGNITFGA